MSFTDLFPEYAASYPAPTVRWGIISTRSADRGIHQMVDTPIRLESCPDLSGIFLENNPAGIGCYANTRRVYSELMRSGDYKAKLPIQASSHRQRMRQAKTQRRRLVIGQHPLAGGAARQFACVVPGAPPDDIALPGAMLFTPIVGIIGV
jgi:hypothetical protein